MKDRFFEAENCDRCGKPLNGCRIQSMYNHEVLCMDCKDKETKRVAYRQAVEADHAEIRRGNYNFFGIGLKKDENHSGDDPFANGQASTVCMGLMLARIRDDRLATVMRYVVVE